MASSISLSTAIFSPSVARQAASVARDWNHVDLWLGLRLGNPVIAFERNVDTLQLLIALASCNSVADEERIAVAGIATSADNNVDTMVESGLADSSRENYINHGERRRFANLPTSLLGPLEAEIHEEGAISLDALAITASISDGTLYHDGCKSMGEALVPFRGRVSDNVQVLTRTHTIRAFLDTEVMLLNLQLAEMSSSIYRASPYLAQTNLDLQRGIKTMLVGQAELDECGNYREGLYSSTAALINREQTHIERMLYSDLLNHNLRPFNGLPSDPEVARSHIDNRRRGLHILVEHRDRVFEALVAQESPTMRR